LVAIVALLDGRLHFAVAAVANAAVLTAVESTSLETAAKAGVGFAVVALFVSLDHAVSTTGDRSDLFRRARGVVL
jgi:hypothetical protein